MDRSRRFRQPQPTPTSDSAPALPGTDFAYEVARTELSRTHKRITRIDTIAGILIGVLTAATGGGHPPVPWRHRVRRCDARDTTTLRP